MSKTPDALALVHAATIAASRAPTLLDALRALAPAAGHVCGGGAVTIVVRDDAMEPRLLVRVVPNDGGYAESAVTPVRAVVWRRWLRTLERRAAQLMAPGAAGTTYALPFADPWVRREFGPALCGIAIDARRSDEGGVPPTDRVVEPAGLLIAPLGMTDGVIDATLVVEVLGAWPLAPEMVRAIELVGHQVAQHVAAWRLTALSDRRAERLQRLQEAGAALARSLDEHEVERELARQVARLIQVDGVVIAHPDMERGTVRTPLRVVRGLARPRADQALGAGPIAEAARTGRLLRIDDYTAAATPLASADDVVGDGGPARSLLVAPMRVGTQLVGVIAVHAAAPGAFNADDEELMRAVAAQAGTAIANARLFADSEAERRQSEAFAEVARAVGGSLRFGDVLRLALRHTSALLRAEGACVALERGEHLHIVAGVGSAALLSGVHVPVGASMLGMTVREARYWISNAIAADDPDYRALQRVTPVRKAVHVPLIAAGAPIGVIAAVNRDADFTEDDARILQRLADHVAVAIVNARLFEEAATATREWKVAFDAIAAGMVVVDDASRIVRANARAAELTLGGTFAGADALLGRVLHDALALDASSADVVARACAGEVGRGPVRATVPTRDGTRRFDLLAAPHPDGGAVVTFDDVTAYHALAERYRLVVETGRDAIVMTDLDGRIAFANAAAHALFGRGPELLGMPTASLVREADLHEIERRGELARAGSPQRYDIVVRRVDGEERIVAVASAPLGELGSVTGVVASLRDVTDERGARQALAESEARYRRLVESASDAIYTLDASGVCTSANDATSRLVSVPHEELVGMTSAAFVAPEDRALVRERFEASVRGHPQRFECRMVGAGGERRIISVTHTPIGRTDAGTAEGVLAVARDVTLERERAAALERSEARYERLVEAASDVIFTVDADGCFTAVNHALVQATGRARDALLGTNASDLLGNSDESAVMALLREALRGNRARGEALFHDNDAGERVGSVVAAPIVERGAVVGALAIIRDVTDERRLAEQLIQREKLATVGRLVRGVAHELNNPLASISTLAELLATDGDLETVVETAGTIHREAMRAAKIVERLHAFARQRAPERVPTDVNRSLLDALDLRRHALRMQEVDLIVDLDYEIPATWADAHQLQQVFLQLIAACEQTFGDGDGSGVARTLALLTRRDGSTLVARIVASGGRGHVDATDTAAAPFVLATELLREHGGQLHIDSERDTTFVVELPFVQPPADAPAPPE